ncbi:uncharacterized methyltransferase-like C25B8.10 [Xenopus laevis]|uniref:Uncharacterized methyltransferase-like C25B8.10 n=1 Tax=Xenopus laevis TaxID=8355 RepID=A0A8J1LYA7_XENLA|nr:uncharacterized methyltransferase-like C25B8.10 [Xenopus laevis]
MEEAKEVKMPMEVEYLKDENVERLLTDNHQYRKVIDKLLFIMTVTRPDIAAAVGILCRKVSAPSHHDWNAMAVDIFHNKEFSDAYQAGMIVDSPKIKNLIISYLEEKKGKPFELAVDAGCGTGRSTRTLAPHFQKVIGIDVSKSQISVARKCTSHENISYQISPAEELPLEDASVDLINAGLAAHWFNPQKFGLEAARVLKHGGCLALHSFSVVFEIEYKDKSEELTAAFSEALEILSDFNKKVVGEMKTMYPELFSAIPFKDKQRISGIREVFLLTVSEIMSFLQAMCLYKEFLEQDKDKATAFLQDLEKRLLDLLGESASDVLLGFHVDYFCLLASKP